MLCIAFLGSKKCTPKGKLVYHSGKYVYLECASHLLFTTTPSIISRQCMDKTCSEKCLLKIALLQFDWKSLGRLLLNTEQDIKDIDHEEKEEQHKREKVLLKWKEQKGSSATYQKLFDTVKEIGNKDTAERVEQLAVDGMFVNVIMMCEERALLCEFGFSSILHSKAIMIKVSFSQ